MKPGTLVEMIVKFLPRGQVCVLKFTRSEPNQRLICTEVGHLTRGRKIPFGAHFKASLLTYLFGRAEPANSTR